MTLSGHLNLFRTPIQAQCSYPETSIDIKQRKKKKNHKKATVNACYWQAQRSSDVDCFAQEFLSESRFADLANTGAGTVKPPVVLQCCSWFPQLVGQIRADITFPW